MLDLLSVNQLRKKKTKLLHSTDLSLHCILLDLQYPLQILHNTQFLRKSIKQVCPSSLNLELAIGSNSCVCAISKSSSSVKNILYHTFINLFNFSIACIYKIASKFHHLYNVEVCKAKKKKINSQKKWNSRNFIISKSATAK